MLSKQGILVVAGGFVAMIVGLELGCTPKRGGSDCYAPLYVLTMHQNQVLEWARESDGVLPDSYTAEKFAAWELPTRYFEDDWGRPFKYRIFADGKSFLLETLGKDGERGGKGADLDGVLVYDGVAKSGTIFIYDDHPRR